MGLDSKLEKWLRAGVIDTATAERIRAHEAHAGRPYALWAVAALGLLAVGLGAILIVSANWDRIADPIKLGVHGMLLAAALGTAWHGVRRGRIWQTEGALFLAGALLLAGIALHAQIWQLSGPLWEAGLGWLVVISPAFLLIGRTGLTGAPWALMLMGTLAAMALERPGDTPLSAVADGLALASPAALLLLAGWLKLVALPFAKALRDTAIPVLLAAASIAHFAWASTIAPADAALWAWRFLPAALMTAAAVLLGGRRDLVPPPVLAAVLIGPLLAAAAALALPHPDGWLSRLIGVLIYAAMWGWIARAAATSGWNRLFGVAIAAIAVRIFIVYIELFGTLASTGLGLVAGGVLMVLLALGWRRLMARRGVA